MTLSLKPAKMTKIETKTEPQKDEFSKIFDEYRAKIDEISRKAGKNPAQTGTAADGAGQDAEEAEVTVSSIQTKTAGNAKDLITPVDLAAEEIIRAAKRRAQQIIDEAEEKSKKEATKKTQSQVEKIIGKAKKDAEDMLEQARQATAQENNAIAAAARQEAEHLIREITEKCRRDTQKESSRAVHEAREKAEKMTTGIVANCQEINRMINEIVSRTRQTIEEFEAKLKTDAMELARTITETQQKIQQFAEFTVKEEEEARPAPFSKGLEPEKTSTLSVRVLGAKSNGQHGSQPLFSGKVEMKSISSSFDYQYLKSLKKYLTHIPNIKYVQEYASEKEIAILFELKEPLPLLDILRNVPQVEDVITAADDINIVFKNSLQV